MSIQLNIPTVSFQRDTVPLGGTIYNIEYSYNERDNAGEGRWRLDISDEFGKNIITGIKIVEPQRLLARYKLENFSGELEVIRVIHDAGPLVFDNFGVNKDYALLYWTEEELIAGGITP